MPFAGIPRLSLIAAISVVGSMMAMKTEPSADWRKEGWAHMPAFTPARTRAFSRPIESEGIPESAWF